jgi:hypothetical protein
MWSDFPRTLCPSAHIGGHVLMSEGQTCSLDTAFTTYLGNLHLASKRQESNLNRFQAKRLPHGGKNLFCAHERRNKASSVSVIWHVILFRQKNTDRPLLYHIWHQRACGRIDSPEMRGRAKAISCAVVRLSAWPIAGKFCYEGKTREKVNGYC